MPSITRFVLGSDIASAAARVCFARSRQCSGVSIASGIRMLIVVGDVGFVAECPACLSSESPIKLPQQPRRRYPESKANSYRSANNEGVHLGRVNEARAAPFQALCTIAVQCSAETWQS
jgi:hypothetical protein